MYSFGFVQIEFLEKLSNVSASERWENLVIGKSLSANLHGNAEGRQLGRQGISHYRLIGIHYPLLICCCAWNLEGVKMFQQNLSG